MSDARLPTGLYVDAHLATLTRDAVPFYFIQKGNHSSGLLLVKINGLKGQVRLITQQRDFMEDKLVWAPALEEEVVEEQRERRAGYEAEQAAFEAALARLQAM